MCAGAPGCGKGSQLCAIKKQHCSSHLVTELAGQTLTPKLARRPTRLRQGHAVAGHQEGALPVPPGHRRHAARRGRGAQPARHGGEKGDGRGRAGQRRYRRGADRGGSAGAQAACSKASVESSLECSLLACSQVRAAAVCCACNGRVVRWHEVAHWLTQTGQSAQLE